MQTWLSQSFILLQWQINIDSWWKCEVSWKVCKPSMKQNFGTMRDVTLCNFLHNLLHYVIWLCADSTTSDFNHIVFQISHFKEICKPEERVWPFILEDITTGDGGSQHCVMRLKDLQHPFFFLRQRRKGMVKPTSKCLLNMFACAWVCAHFSHYKLRADYVFFP